MGSGQTLLQLLQSKSAVDCDTMDVEVPKALGPFVDCTSNQAIAVGELSKSVHKTKIDESVKLAGKLSKEFPNIPRSMLAGEIAMLKIQLEIAHYITGYIHIQTNPYFSYDAGETFANASRIVQLSTTIDPTFDPNRLCIKIPSTWEGLQACRALEKEGIRTLATTLFTLEQAALAYEVGCLYIAPYVNELKVHFVPDFVDANVAASSRLCVDYQNFYSFLGSKTKVLPASLTSIDEVMALAGVDHITVAPTLLAQLAATPGSSFKYSLFDAHTTRSWTETAYKDNEAKYRIAFIRSCGGDGEGERKLVQAINIFCDMQDKLEALMV